MDADNEQVEQLLLDMTSDAFNSSLRALEVSGVIDLAKMRSAYSGASSELYDLVTREMLRVIRL